jgi:HD-like signal output (HDOD) protein
MDSIIPQIKDCDMNLNINEILIDFKESPPIVYHKLQRTLKKPESSFEDFANIINTDPKITARLLNLVNSSFYGFSKKIESVHHAISIIGLKQLIELILSTEIINKFKGISVELIDAEAFWIHSVACGLAARAIAVKKGSQTEKVSI